MLSSPEVILFWLRPASGGAKPGPQGTQNTLQAGAPAITQHRKGSERGLLQEMSPASQRVSALSAQTECLGQLIPSTKWK